MAISPTAVANELMAPKASSRDRKNATVSFASLSNAALW